MAVAKVFKIYNTVNQVFFIELAFGSARHPPTLIDLSISKYKYKKQPFHLLKEVFEITSVIIKLKSSYPLAGTP
jgi:hypothetical protein